MARERKNISLDSETIRKGNEIVKEKCELRDFSHLVEILILKDYSNFKRGKKQ